LRPTQSMSHAAHVAFRLLGGTAGALLLYGALFLYEDEHGKVQNTLEEWWIRLREKQTELLARHTVFMREVARLEKRVFDRLFGERLISLRAIGVSQSYSLASTGLAVILAYAVAAHYRPAL